MQDNEVPVQTLFTSPARRFFDASDINRVCNHEKVRPFLGGDVDTPLDLTGILGNTSNIGLECGGFYSVYIQVVPGHYEIHTMIDPDAPPADTVASACATLQYMFTTTNCVEVVTRVPDSNKRARRLAEASGMVKEFRVSRGWQVGGSVEECDILTLPLTAWIAKAPGLETWGEGFHHQIDEACARAGVTRAEHPDDSNHDRYAGAAFAMVKGGQVSKAVFAYNRWALVSGYMPIACINIKPLVVHIGDMALEVHEDRLEVIRCL
jgi:hypothetical protein